MKCDFHFHSTFSDGSETVDKIFRLACNLKLGAVALTDHDTVLGIPAEREASRKYKLPFIPAAEFTAKESGIRFHVLGYHIDSGSDELICYSNELLNCMNERSKKQIKMMRENGIDISEDEFFRGSGGGPLYRAKLLGVLAGHGYVEKGRIMSMLPEFFGVGAPYYQEDLFLYRSFSEICFMIKRNGGIAVLAHPEKIKKKSETLFRELIRSPLLDGLEVYHPANSQAVRGELLSAADERGIICTGGTDFHGLYMKKPIPLGSEDLPVAVCNVMAKYLEQP